MEDGSSYGCDGLTWSGPPLPLLLLLPRRHHHHHQLLVCSSSWLPPTDTRPQGMCLCLRVEASCISNIYFTIYNIRDVWFGATFR